MPRRRPRRRDREEDSLPKFIDQLQYLAGIIASCYLERQYRKGGNPGFLLIGLGAAAIGAYALGGCVGSFLEDEWEAYI
jgi:hypothetical protein